MPDCSKFNLVLAIYFWRTTTPAGVPFLVLVQLHSVLRNSEEVIKPLALAPTSWATSCHFYFDTANKIGLAPIWMVRLKMG